MTTERPLARPLVSAIWVPGGSLEGEGNVLATITPLVRFLFSMTLKAQLRAPPLSARAGPAYASAGEGGG